LATWERGKRRGAIRLTEVDGEETREDDLERRRRGFVEGEESGGLAEFKTSGNRAEENRRMNSAGRKTEGKEEERGKDGGRGKRRIN
jgi:hypothetical protein